MGPAIADDVHSRPAGMCVGRGHLIVYGNPAFVAEFGPDALGVPAREAMVDLPPEAFELLDAVLARGRPFARWIVRDGVRWRMTARPRVEYGTDEPYGVAFHLRAEADRAVLLPASPRSAR